VLGLEVDLVVLGEAPSSSAMTYEEPPISLWICARFDTYGVRGMPSGGAKATRAVLLVSSQKL